MLNLTNIRRHINRRTIIIAMVAVAVVSAGIFIALQGSFVNKNKISDTAARPCAGDTALISGYLVAIQKFQSDSIRVTAEKVKATPNHEQDVNCLYILLKRSLYTGSSVEARDYFGQIKAKYGDNNKFNPVIAADGDNLNSLEPSVEFLENQAKELQNNVPNR